MSKSKSKSQDAEADRLVVRAEIPGVDPDEDISVDGGRLSIQVVDTLG